MTDKWANLYPILPWDAFHGFDGQMTRRHGLKSIADCNFTMAGFVWPEDLKACEELGLAAILFNEEQNTASFSWVDKSEEEIDDIIRCWVERAGDSPSLYGYYIVDEPGTQDFQALGWAVAALNKYAPDKAAYINLFPNYATMGAPGSSQLGTDTYEDYLERFVTEVKPPFISYDSYQVQYSQDAREADKMASYYTNLLQVREVALRHDLPWWQIVSAMQIFDAAMPPTPATMLLQAYTTLAAGGHSVGWFTYYSYGSAHAPIDDQERVTWIWHYLAETNRQIKLLGSIMNQLASTGVFFTGLQEASEMADLPSLPGELIEQASAAMPLMIGEFRGADGEPYLMLVNLSPERSARVELDWRADTAGWQTFNVGNGCWQAYERDAQLWLAPGMGMLLGRPAPRDS
ncbi:MAG: hypothetical protein GXY52_00405 [Chloroflexi bacterium]|nr:hypothetical protein [Chloroflexota bacterium]